VQGDDDAHEALTGEGNDDARADFRRKAAESVGEAAVERDRERDVGVEGHDLRVSPGVVRMLSPSISGSSGCATARVDGD
jgi:hypothetical protein